MLEEMTKLRPLGELLRRPPRYGINAAAVPLTPGLPTYIRITDIDDQGRFSPSPKVGVNHPKSADYVLRDGELVFARTGASVGKSYLYDPRDGVLVFAGFLISIAPDARILNPKYLSLVAHTQAYWDWVARTSVRSGQPGINGREYGQLLIPLADIATQDAIASAMTDVDDLIESLERLIAKKQAIKQGMAQQLLTGKVRLPGFAEPWMWRHFAEIMTRLNAKRHQVPATDYQDIGRLPVVDQGKEPVVAYTDRVEAALRPAPDGVIVFGDHTCITKFVDFDFAVGADGTQVLRGLSGNSTRFLAYALELSPVVSTGYNRHFKFLREKVLPAPSLAEQNAIAATLADCDKEIATLGKRLTTAEAIRQGMMQEFLKAHTRLPVGEGAS
jgi:type I restriction enzyme S subunit